MNSEFTVREARDLTADVAELMVTLPDGWVRTPLPDNDGALRMALPFVDCRTCGPATLTHDGDQWGPYTRTVEPDPGTGLYLLQPHQPWCPIWTGKRAELGCPACGAPIEGYDSSWGYRVPVLDPDTGGVKHLVGNANDILDPWPQLAPDEPPTREYTFDRMVLQPCGHTIEGCDAHRLGVRINTWLAARRYKAAEAAIAAYQTLLDAAERATHGMLADAYRGAVHTGSGDASGLLKALILLHPDADKATP